MLVQQFSKDVKTLDQVIARNKFSGGSRFLNFPCLLVRPTSNIDIQMRPDLRKLSIKSAKPFEILSDVKLLGYIQATPENMRPLHPSFNHPYLQK